MQAVAVEPLRKIWTREEWHALEDSGVLEGQRLELIEGELLSKMGQSPGHAYVVTRIAAAMARAFAPEQVRCQCPVEPSPGESIHSLPLPDVLVTRESGEAFARRHPGADDVLVVVEVADTSLAFDTGGKARLYSRSGFAEYVVADVRFHRLFVFRQPEDGEYRWSAILGPEDEFRPLAAPDRAWKVRDLLGE